MSETDTQNYMQKTDWIPVCLHVQGGSYTSDFFFLFFVKKVFFTFLCWIWIDVSQQYCENFRKIEQAELVENLPPSYLPYKFLHNLHSFLLWEKVIF